MNSTRVFLLSPALARLIERERAGHLVQQGYFPEHPERSTHVQVAGEAGHLVLVSHAATVQRFVTPTPLDLVTMAFRDDKTARKFQPPA